MSHVKVYNTTLKESISNYFCNTCKNQSTTLKRKNNLRKYLIRKIRAKKKKKSL